MFRAKNEINALYLVINKLAKDLNYAEKVIYRLMNDMEENTFNVAAIRVKLGMPPIEAADKLERKAEKKAESTESDE